MARIGKYGECWCLECKVRRQEQAFRSMYRSRKAAVAAVVVIVLAAGFAMGNMYANRVASQSVAQLGITGLR